MNDDEHEPPHLSTFNYYTERWKVKATLLAHDDELLHRHHEFKEKLRR